MSKVKATPSIENLIDEMHQLSADEQRSLAAKVLDDRKLEAFVEEMDDHLVCERAAEEENASTEKISLAKAQRRKALPRL